MATYKQPVSSITGRVVTKEYADAHPNETYWRTVHVRPRTEVMEMELEDTLQGEDISAEPMMPPEDDL
jgi:hypothetical protein